MNNIKKAGCTQRNNLLTKFTFMNKKILPVFFGLKNNCRMVKVKSPDEVKGHEPGNERKA